jgi:NAD+ synthase (glutamine-hydrolysing)
LKWHEIKSCVVGISGGIDSAVTLGILNYIKKQDNSPLQAIIPVLLPFNNDCGVTNQARATEDGKSLIAGLGLTSYEINLSSAHQLIHSAVIHALGIDHTAWAAGQLASNIRTPVLYHLATLQTQAGLKAVVCGTTNRDEGGYLGYFGKASDGMVDIQIISDIHKSEVYLLAKHLSLPGAILKKAPTGDTYDGRTDEEAIGCTYDEIELYAAYLNHEVDRATLELDPAFRDISAVLEERHRINKHKYLVGSPAVHLDVYERAVKGGWHE